MATANVDQPRTGSAAPAHGTIRDCRGNRCPAARKDSYPLRAKCEKCGLPIVCLDGSAEWMHTFPLQATCLP